jgi:hypothetical protein
MKLKQIGLWLDQGVNVLCDGYADETLSARAYRNKDKSKKWNFFMRVFNKIFFWQKEHCKSAYEQEQTRRHMPPEYRNK